MHHFWFLTQRLHERMQHRTEESRGVVVTQIKSHEYVLNNVLDQRKQAAVRVTQHHCQHPWSLNKTRIRWSINRSRRPFAVFMHSSDCNACLCNYLLVLSLTESEQWHRKNKAWTAVWWKPVINSLVSSVFIFFPLVTTFLPKKKSVLLFFEYCSAVLRAVIYVLSSLPVDIGWVSEGSVICHWEGSLSCHWSAH